MTRLRELDSRFVCKENEILAEIHRVRAEHARECNYDVDVIFAEMREDLKRLQTEGWQVVSPAPREAESTGALREEPPKEPGHEHLQGGEP